MVDNLSEDELIEDTLQKAWDRLLALRKEGKLPGFDIEVPAQIQSWLCDIYSSQLSALQLANREAWRTKMFSIAMAYRISLRATVGIDYFMRQMNDEGRMRAMDKLITDLERTLKKEMDVKRLLR